MFTLRERERLRDALVAAARTDDRIIGAALTGSGARGAEDDWSDIDLALGLSDDADRSETLDAWTRRMYDDHDAVAHTDVSSRQTIYRVFLLRNTLQVDIAFAPRSEFGARASTFQLIFGTETEQEPFTDPDSPYLIGMAWLHALHVRSSLARGRVWQAAQMINGARDHVIALACLRHGTRPVQGRGTDDLPAETLSTLTGTVPATMDADELSRAFGELMEMLLNEVGAVDGDMAGSLARPLRELADRSVNSAPTRRP